MGALELRSAVTDRETRHEYAAHAAKAQMREHISRQFYICRTEILTGNEQAIADVNDGLIDHFRHSRELRYLVRIALSQGCDTVGREFLRILKDVMQMNAEYEAETELKRMGM